jgi:ribosomal protein S18 acetylase RimI-like enzyme
MYWQRPGHLPRSEFARRSDQRDVNLAEKKALVEAGRSPGILVYLDGTAVGWCQYRPAELPSRGASDDGELDWRITCFVTDKRHRRRGVAKTALRAALDAIARDGGGLVHGMPIAFGPDQNAVQVNGVGLVRRPYGTFGNVSSTGTVGLFEAEGFVAVRDLGGGRVLVRRTVAPE